MTVLMVSLVLALTNIMHVGQLAEYYVSQQEKSLNIKVVIEKDEMLNFNFNSNCDVKKMTSLCVANHIRENLVLEINNQIITLELGDSYTLDGHLTLFLTGELNDIEIKSLNITNNCFYEFHDGYRNRVILNLNKIHSSYMLTSKERSFSIKN
jgi:hypothetical protein